MEKARLTKRQLAKRLGISVSSMYYQHIRPVVDEEVKNQIETVLTDNPAYGHKRLALALKLNKKRILRVMKKYNIKPYKRRTKKFVKKADLGKKPAIFPNLLKDTRPLKPDEIWTTDFTYIRYKNKFIYLATVLDLFTREIVGVNVSRFHTKELVLGALEDALTRYSLPKVIHSDQGSEYDSEAYISFCEKLGIAISMSEKGSPWQNGYQESFYSNFKLELADSGRFNDIGELVEEILRLVWYHNNMRIHTALKTSPFKYRESYYRKLGT